MDSEILVTLYDQLYALSDDEGFELNHIGWNSSFDGSAYTTEQMSEWRDETADNVRLFDHGRILEVACGTEDPMETIESMHSWENCTESGACFREFEGGHFFIEDNIDEVIGYIREHISL